MPFDVKLESRQTRTDQIDNLDARAATDRVTFRGRQEDLPTKLVPIDLMTYRVRNIRTIVAQAEYLRANGEDPQLFSDGQESLSAQKLQHEFLVDLSKDASGNIYAELAETANQTEPLLITYRGVVLNGNRRLAAMRDLYAKDSTRYSSFGHIEVAILPSDANEDDLMVIETGLQIAEDFKSEYGWLAEALGLRRQIEEFDWKYEDASKHWRESENELRDRLSRLIFAEQFLEYSDQVSQYGVVKDDLEAFRTFQTVNKSRKNTDQSRLEAEKSIAFALIANKKKIKDSVYNYVRAISSISDRVIPIAEGELTEQVSEQPRQDDPLQALAAPDSVGKSVRDYLSDFSNSEKVAEWAIEAFKDIRFEARSEKKGQQFKKNAETISSQAANLGLKDADVDSVAPGVSQLVVALDRVSVQIVEAVQAHKSMRSNLDENRLKATRDRLSKLLSGNSQ